MQRTAMYDTSKIQKPGAVVSDPSSQMSHRGFLQGYCRAFPLFRLPEIYSSYKGNVGSNFSMHPNPWFI